MSITSRLNREGQTAAGAETPELTILYGSQSGNAEYLAHQIHTASQKNGDIVELRSMEEWMQPGDRSLRRLLVVTSTHGDGDMPDNAEGFWGWISALEPGALEGLPYAVLSIGDSMYENFCKAGHDIDRRLQELGAVRVVEGIDCDIDFEFSATRWAGPAVADLLATEAWLGDPPKEWESATASTVENDLSERRHTARVVESSVLSKPGSSKRVMHYELAVDDASFTYEPGDSISVFISNPDDLVDMWLDIFGDRTIAGPDGARQLRDILLREVELRLPHPGLVIGLARLRPDNATVSRVMELIQGGSRDELDDWLWGRDVLDVLRELECLDLPIEAILETLRPLQHRDYSIASSPLRDEGRVHLTVNSVVYDRGGRAHRGAATAFLQARAADGEPFEVRRIPAHEFRLPNPETPIVMIGPGVGVAPFRAFLRHREAGEARGRNWLFFGDQHREFDFLYEDEFIGLSRRKVLTKLDAAFSRDQAEKHYVQHNLLANAVELRRWIDDGAYIFICGDKTHMARDVDRALGDILNSKHRPGLLGELKAAGRYAKDVY